MSEGTLLAFLRRNPDEHRVRYVSTCPGRLHSLPERHYTKIFHILQGLDFMHRLGVIHGDLKAVRYSLERERKSS
jgi:serine/threonine protein kinase